MGTEPSRRRPLSRGARQLMRAAFGAAALAALATGCTAKDQGPPPPPTTSANQGTTPSGGAAFGLPLDPDAAIRSAGLREISIESPPELAARKQAHLDVTVNGQPVTVPAGIGTTKSARAPIHTVDESGVIHIVPEQSDKPETLTIGQFFTQWAVKLDKNCLATYCTDDKNQLLGYLNGQLVPDPASIPLADGAEIVVWYGPKGTNPKVPGSYAFAPVPPAP